MRKLHIGIIDLVAKAPTISLWDRIMNANYASIIPQAIASWCEEEGHDVTFVCYTGVGDLFAELPDHLDLVFMAAFTQSAQFAYALSHRLRSQGAVTVLGGPHARCYPQDARQYFDYVLGFTDKPLIREVLQDREQHRPLGLHLEAARQPVAIPGVAERWKFIELTHRKAPLLKIVPMLSSVGCPYTCGFCIDSVVPYQPLDFDVIKEDLRFLLRKFKRPHVVWYDPSFGVRFSEHIGAIEEAIPPNSIDFIAEIMLSVLTEPHLQQLKKNGFKALLPGIESWYGLSNKTRSGSLTGLDKVRQVSEHVNLILKYIPFVQTNFVFGLDGDEGPEPFELTKRFVDLTPGAFPAYCLLTAFGQAAPVNLEYQHARRVLPFPFHFLSNLTLNVKPKHYSWMKFYDNMIGLTQHSFSWRALVKRHRVIKEPIPRWSNLLRGLSTEGAGRLKYYREVRRRLHSDPQVRRYFEQETTELPQFYLDQVQKDLNSLWAWLPEGALHHDPNAFLKSVTLEAQMLANVKSASGS